MNVFVEFEICNDSDIDWFVERREQERERAEKKEWPLEWGGYRLKDSLGERVPRAMLSKKAYDRGG